MPTYIYLNRLTQKGIENIKESPNRLDAAKEAFRAAGGKLKEVYVVTGQYDAVIVSEFPNDEAAAKVALAIGAAGNVRTETLRAFTETEYRKIIAELP